MRQWIRDQNIRRFKAALASVLPPEQRAMIEALLAEELAESEVAQESIPALSGAFPKQASLQEALPPTRLLRDEGH